MPEFLLSYRVPGDYQPGAETGKAWQAWFEIPGSSRTDTGYGVVATRTLGKLDAQTRLGGYSVVTAEDMEGAAALAEGCPALQLGGGVEIGAVPELAENLRAGTDAVWPVRLAPTFTHAKPCASTNLVGERRNRATRMRHREQIE